MVFENNGLGKCVILKKSETFYFLIYAFGSGQFVVASDLNAETGSWIDGHYFDDDLDSALAFFNEITEKQLNDDIER